MMEDMLGVLEDITKHLLICRLISHFQVVVCPQGNTEYRGNVSSGEKSFIGNKSLFTLSPHTLNLRQEDACNETPSQVQAILPLCEYIAWTSKLGKS